MNSQYCTHERPIEAELVVHRRDVGLAGAGLDQQGRRVAGHPDEQEDRQRQQEQRQQRIADAPDDVLLHDVLDRHALVTGRLDRDVLVGRRVGEAR